MYNSFGETIANEWTPKTVCESRADWLKFEDLSNRDQLVGERSDPPRVCEYSKPTPSVISVSGFALADRVLKIPNGRHKTQNKRDEGSLIFYSYSKRM